jgi:predicted phage-related endonuclease
MGLNPYMTPYQYWRVKKMETLETAAEEDNDSMIRGRFKEDAISRMFEQATGEKIVKRSEQIEVYRNDKYPSYMQAAPDREVFAAGRSTRYILECKDTKMHLPELTPETVPMLWYTQVMYQMGIMERDAAYIAAEEGGKRLVYALFDFDRSKFAYIVEYCRDWFERYILGDEIPPVETGQDVILAWPVSEAAPREADSEIRDTIAWVRTQRSKVAAMQAEITKAEERVKAYFMQYDTITYDGRPLATFKTVTSRRLDSKALKADNPDIYAKYVKESTTRQLLFK